MKVLEKDNNTEMKCKCNDISWENVYKWTGKMVVILNDMQAPLAKSAVALNNFANNTVGVSVVFSNCSLICSFCLGPLLPLFDCLYLYNTFHL